MKKERLYKDLAWTWPIISPPENYKIEAKQFYTVIKQYSKIPTRTLLDLGCGGGHNDYHLKHQLEVTGVDISDEMLALARELNPEVDYLLGDMRDIRLGMMFDAVIIADSIMYMTSQRDLRAAFQTAFDHLRPGGVFSTYVEETPEGFQQNQMNVNVGRKGETEVVLIENIYDPDPNDSQFESVFIYLIRQGGELEIETDHHINGLFSLETWEQTLKDVGFEVNQTVFEEEKEYPMFVCLKPI